MILGSWDVSTYDINKERSFNEYSYLRDPDSRAAILGLQPTGINPTGAIEADNENIWLVNPPGASSNKCTKTASDFSRIQPNKSY